MCENTYAWPYNRDGVQKAACVVKLDRLAALSAQLVSIDNQIATLSVQKSKNEQMASSSASYIPAEVWEEADYQTHTYTYYYPEIRNHDNCLYAN